MTGEIDLEAVKARLTGKLMAIEGVTGLGIGQNRINVYLKEDNDHVRAAVAGVMSREAPGTPFDYFVTGSFSAQ